MSKYASNVVAQAVAWVGCKESDGTHKQIIDVYNGHKPLARGYTVKYTDPWCASFVSAVAIELGYTDIIPTECSCPKMVELLKQLGAWVEDDSRIPNTGDLIFYNWADDGEGDNTGAANHVGIVEMVVGNTITVIEGNYYNSVRRRTLAVNGKYIRGYGVPKYDAEQFSAAVQAWQKAAIADGFSFPQYGADGEWGAECVSVAQKAIVKRRLTYKYKNLTKIVQAAVGVTVDGLCGAKTAAAIKAFQQKHGLTADGQVGLNTWKKILGIE